MAVISIHFCEEVAQLKRLNISSFPYQYLLYPFLRRSGPIETQLSLFTLRGIVTLSISAKKWPN